LAAQQAAAQKALEDAQALKDIIKDITPVSPA